MIERFVFDCTWCEFVLGVVVSAAAGSRWVLCIENTIDHSTHAKPCARWSFSYLPPVLVELSLPFQNPGQTFRLIEIAAIKKLSDQKTICLKKLRGHCLFAT